MLYYLDTVIVIYAVEGNPADQHRALNHLTALEQAGHRFAISGLTRTGCLVPVLCPGGGPRLTDFFRFFHMHVLPSGFVRIRHYGLLANRHRRERLSLCRELLGVATASEGGAGRASEPAGGHGATTSDEGSRTTGWREQIPRPRESMIPRAGGEAMQLAGHRITFYRKQLDGRWLLARDAHTLSPVAKLRP